MNLDHVFFDVNERGGFALLRTTSKGKILATYECFENFDREDGIVKNIIKPFSKQFVRVCRVDANTHRCLDGEWLFLADLAWPLEFSNLISDRTLDTLAKHFDVGSAEDDNAVAENCVTMAKVYWAMMVRYRSSLLGEEAIREFGGNPLAGFRRLIGF